jgi:hypothetical protein
MKLMGTSYKLRIRFSKIYVSKIVNKILGKFSENLNKN